MQHLLAIERIEEASNNTTRTSDREAGNDEKEHLCAYEGKFGEFHYFLLEINRKVSQTGMKNIKLEPF